MQTNIFVYGTLMIEDIVFALTEKKFKTKDFVLKNYKRFSLKISKIRNKYLQNSKPVSTLVEISNTVKPGCDIEIDVIAMK